MLNESSSKKELFVNASTHDYIVFIVANNEQVLISNKHDAASYFLGSYSLSNGVRCIDSLNIKSVYRNEFCNISQGIIQLFDEQFILVSDEKLNIDTYESVDLLLMQKFRTDVTSLNRVFTPKVVLLDAAMSNRNRFKLKKQLQDLNVELIDLKTHVDLKSY